MTNRRYAALGNFSFVEMAKPTPQRLSIEISAYAGARVQAFTGGVGDKEGFRQIYKTMRERFEKFSVPPSHVKRRQLVFFPRMEDIRFENGEFDIAEPAQAYLQLFKDRTEPRGADIALRHENFGIVVEEVFDRFYRDADQPPDDLIHVTCSGYLAPSPAQKLVVKKGWFETRVTHSYHMGCYGAFPAIRMAQGFISSARDEVGARLRQVDVVHSEVPSLHRHFVDLSPQDILVMSLFADGFVKYGVYPEELLRRRDLPGLRILALDERLLPDSLDGESWVPGPHHFEMSMAITVPVVIKQNVASFVDRLFTAAGLDFEAQKDRLVFAIHPGGPQMIEHIRAELGLRPEQVALGAKVFFEKGNMSSATVPLVLKEILDSPDVAAGTKIVAIGFGPGLTIAGLLLEKI
ncbi:3-oxoacyl-[acyl-carrier-protein] synthase III C-terminal domain-containing protein [Methylocystis sp. IM3]|uniref:3-oxoacyl-[acyl-carrier-protein] synthase III C-terminal domain-containing protein n=1 Tax=unclassified Methylocystis TaxID=2625913 RepID=UPI0030F67AA2